MRSVGVMMLRVDEHVSFCPILFFFFIYFAILKQTKMTLNFYDCPLILSAASQEMLLQSFSVIWQKSVCLELINSELGKLICETRCNNELYFATNWEGRRVQT